MKRIIACAVLASAMLSQLAAQERNIQHRRLYAVKWGHLEDFISTVKELQALYKKAGVDAPMIGLQSLTGPDRIMLIRYYPKISDALANRRDAFKGQYEADYLALNMRLSQFVDDRNSRVAERDTELSLPRPAELPAFFRVIETRVKPGKEADFRALVKEYISPAVKTAGFKSYTVLRTRLGGSTSEFATGAGMDSLTELDDLAIIKALGQAKYTAYLAKRAALIDYSEVNLYRLRKDITTWTNPK